MKAYSIDFRQKIIEVHEKEKISQRQFYWVKSVYERMVPTNNIVVRGACPLGT